MKIYKAVFSVFYSAKMQGGGIVGEKFGRDGLARARPP
jgi:hypothetical protein